MASTGLPVAISNSGAQLTMSRLLVIGYVWPEPASTAAGLHMLSLLDLFQGEGWDITFVSPAARTEQMADLESRGIHCVDVEINNSSFDAFLAQLQPQVVVFDRFMIEEQFGWRVEKTCPDALRILDRFSPPANRTAPQS